MKDFVGFLAGFMVFAIASGLVLHLAEADTEKDEATGARSGVAIWLLAFFHANTVIAAAYAAVAKIPLPETPLLVGGLVIAALGWLLFAWATVTLVRRADFEGLQTTKLVTDGPFRFSRHPQSLGWTILLLGIAIASRSVIALGLVVAFGLFASRHARIEERQLATRFGTAFEQYRSRTPVTPGLS
jgi:protein-S-isoprenylcysteine O-methyltransferase Ste14